jgi:hypothetical protein
MTPTSIGLVPDLEVFKRLAPLYFDFDIFVKILGLASLYVNKKVITKILS